MTLTGGSIILESFRVITQLEEIECRLVPDHRDGDLINGAFTRSAVGTVVERKTRCLVLGSSSVRQSIRGINCSAERVAAPPTQR